MKLCASCRETKPLAAFASHASNRDGLQYRCRECSADYYRRNKARHAAVVSAWHQVHRVERQAAAAAWAKAHPQRTKAISAKSCAVHKRKRHESTAKWRAANVERDRARKRAYCQENRALLREYERAYRLRRPDIARKKDSKKRARKAAAFVEHVDVLVLYSRDGARCGICGNHVEMKDKSVDHVIPLARNGEHSYANCQLAHLRCNSAKGARLQEKAA